jgi:hypothetical protein
MSTAGLWPHSGYRGRDSLTYRRGGLCSLHRRDGSKVKVRYSAALLTDSRVITLELALLPVRSAT